MADKQFHHHFDGEQQRVPAATLPALMLPFGEPLNDWVRIPPGTLAEKAASNHVPFRHQHFTKSRKFIKCAIKTANARRNLGGADWTRTSDPSDVNDMLYKHPFSYTIKPFPTG